MADRLKQIPAKILEWWNRFSSKQKTLIVSVAAGVILALAILVTVVTRPQYETLATCETTAETAAIRDLLDENQITYRISDDGLQVMVLAGQMSSARLVLGANNIPSTTYDISNVMSGGFSTTESDKQKKYKLYLEHKMEEDLMTMASIKKADVQLSLPENDGTLIQKEEEAYASVILELEGEFNQENAATVARFIATSLGNTSTNNVVIIDTEGNLLFSGEDNYSVSGSASNQLTVKQQAENLVKNEVKKVLLGTNEFDNVEVASNLNLDFSSTEQTEHRYTPADGQSQGVLSQEDIYSSESSGGTSGVPGTDSNTEQTYQIQDNDYSNSSESEESRKYLPNESITNTTVPPGLIIYSQSSISVAAITYKVTKEEDAKDQGLLDGITWAEYKSANEQRTKLTIDEDLVDMVAKATGIDAANISMVAYEEPMFIDADSMDISATDILQIVLIVVILALLAFVVIRSMRGEKEAQEPVEEELSVESLLQSSPEPTIENIDIEEAKSETRKMVDKFVDENPEAVALLLRNWLNEDWG